MKKTSIASIVGLLLSSNLYAANTEKDTKLALNTDIQTDEVIVSANRFQQKDTETTYASEVHTDKMIDASGATTLYDYLAQQTSVNLLSNFGNKATPSINLRGYGGENGYQNVVITVDGQRLNNIDLTPQLLGAIPLGDIERIEISKGSGSVIYGDGAMAGSIQIYTKAKTGATLSASAGDYGQQTGYFSAGVSKEYFDLFASVSHDSNDGYSKKAADGNKDTYKSDAQKVKLNIKPTDSLHFNIEGTSSRTDVRYPNSLTRLQFNYDPRQNGNPLKAYTHQGLDSDQWRAGVEYNITKEIKISATHYQEEKKSKFPGFIADYDYKSNDLALSFENDFATAIVGYQNFDGQRSDNFGNKTNKDNSGYFLQGEYRLDSLTLSAGARREEVSYHNSSIGAPDVNGDHKLDAWDVGANYRFNSELSMFSNINKSFQSPDIDRAFTFDPDTFNPVFSSFIKPAKAKTLNIGLNHVVANNRFKATTFYSWLHDEIYLDPTIGFFGTNTNIDKSHKYGLELQDNFKVNDHLDVSTIYTYTHSVIDKEIAGDGTKFNGNDLPGAPKHTVVANLNWKFYENASFNLNHTWRSKAYAYNDFGNNFSQKQGNYQTTNIAIHYQYKNFNIFTSVNNLFEHKNSIQVADDAIYPVDFVRTFRVGVKSEF